MNLLTNESYHNSFCLFAKKTRRKKTSYLPMQICILIYFCICLCVLFQNFIINKQLEERKKEAFLSEESVNHYFLTHSRRLQHLIRMLSSLGMICSCSYKPSTPTSFHGDSLPSNPHTFNFNLPKLSAHPKLIHGSTTFRNRAPAIAAVSETIATETPLESEVLVHLYIYLFNFYLMLCSLIVCKIGLHWEKKIT